MKAFFQSLLFLALIELVCFGIFFWRFGYLPDNHLLTVSAFIALFASAACSVIAVLDRR